MTTSRSFRNAENGVLRSYLAGLTLSTAGSSATFSVAAGMAADSTNVDWLTLTSSISKTTSAWAVGSGNGGLDTGAVAINTWYHVHLIKRIDTNVVDVLFSLSATAPTLPANYTLSRRLGAMKTNGSSQWTSFSQLGDEFLLLVPVQDLLISNVINTLASTLTLASVPTGVQVTAVGYFNAQAASTTAFVITALDQTDTAPASNGIGITLTASVALTGAGMTIRTNTSAQFRGRGAAAVNLGFTTMGWIDRRGRDA